MERIRFITHRDKRVLLVDASDLSAQEVSALIDHVPDFVSKEPPGSVLLLGDLSRSHFTKDTIEHMKIAAVFDRPYLKRSAWILTENLPKALLDSIRAFSRRDIPIFATREEALDYLVGESEPT